MLDALGIWKLTVSRNQRLRTKYGRKFMQAFLRLVYPKHVDECRHLYRSQLLRVISDFRALHYSLCRRMSEKNMVSQLKGMITESLKLIPLAKKFHEKILMKVKQAMTNSIRKSGPAKATYFCFHGDDCFLAKLKVCPFYHVIDLKEGDVVRLKVKSGSYGRQSQYYSCVMAYARPEDNNLTRFEFEATDDRKDQEARRFRLPSGEIGRYSQLTCKSSDLLADIAGFLGFSVTPLHLAMLSLIGLSNDNALSFVLKGTNDHLQGLLGLFSLSTVDISDTVIPALYKHPSELRFGFLAMLSAARGDFSSYFLKSLPLFRVHGPAIHDPFMIRHGEARVLRCSEKSRSVWSLRLHLACITRRSSVGLFELERLYKKFNIMSILVSMEYFILRGLPSPALENIARMVLM